MKKKKEKKKNNINLNSQAKRKAGLKVLEKLRNQEKGIPVYWPILIWTYARFFVAGGIFWIM